MLIRHSGDQEQEAEEALVSHWRSLLVQFDLKQNQIPFMVIYCTIRNKLCIKTISFYNLNWF